MPFSASRHFYEERRTLFQTRLPQLKSNRYNARLTELYPLWSVQHYCQAKTRESSRPWPHSSTIITSVCTRQFSQCCRVVRFKLPHCHLSNLMEISPRPHPQKGQLKRSWELRIPPYSASPNTKQGTGTDRTQQTVTLFVTLAQHQPIWFSSERTVLFLSWCN